MQALTQQASRVVGTRQGGGSGTLGHAIRVAVGWAATAAAAHMRSHHALPVQHAVHRTESFRSGAPRWRPTSPPSTPQPSWSCSARTAKYRTCVSGARHASVHTVLGTCRPAAGLSGAEVEPQGLGPAVADATVEQAAWGRDGSAATSAGRAEPCPCRKVRAAAVAPHQSSLFACVQAGGQRAR
mgnify:CR=1 FL=1